MAGDYVYSEEIAAAAPSRFEKFLKLFIVLAVLGLAGELIWLLGITPFRPFSGIEISGYDGIAREEILAGAGISPDSSYFSINAVKAEKALMGFSALESAKVLKYFPDKLKIILESRKPAAYALTSLNDKTVPVLFDNRGVIFQIGGNENDEQLLCMLPVISGLIIEDPFPGMMLPAMFVPLFQELEKIGLSSPELFQAVSEIRINRKSSDSFDLMLYPAHKKIKVRLSELNEDLLRYTLLMVDVLASKENGIDSLDFRSGIASYKPLEVSSE